MTNFDTAREALETSLNSAGSAMAEHEKWQQSLEAQINSLKASWQALSQAFLSSDFLKVGIDLIIKFIDVLTELIDKIGTIPTILTAFGSFKVIKTVLTAFGAKGGGLSSLGGILGILQKAFPSVTNGAKKLVKALQEVSLKAQGSGSALHGFFSLIMLHPYIAIAAVAVTALTAAFAYQKKKAEDTAKEVAELTEKYKEQSEELKKLKGDYDTSDESSMISRYEKLSKGVDNLGRNVSLTADEYSEYQGIVNKIAEQIPSLVSGYDEQGNALLSCKGNVEELTIAYEKLIHAQNQEIITNAGKIGDDYANTNNKLDGDGWWSDGHGFWAGLLTSYNLSGAHAAKFLDYELKNDTVQGLQDLLNATTDKEKDKILKSLKNDRYSSEEIRDALNGAGIDVSNFESPIKALEKTLETDPQKIKNIVDNFYGQFNEAVEKQKSIAQAKLSEAFDVRGAISGLDYGNISEDLQAVAYQVVNSLDKNFFDKLQESDISVEDWTTDMLDQLKAIKGSDVAKIEAAFDLQTKFNDGEVSYGEYVDGLKDTGKLINSLGLDSELETQLKLSIGLNEKGFVEEYQQLRNRLANDEFFNIIPEGYATFIEGLSAEELSVIWDVIPKLEKTEYKETIADVKAALEKEMMLQGLTFDLNLEVEEAGIDALNTALSESVSATGLSSESIAALKGRYAELESQGYDLSSMFEETSTGIRINRQEFNKLENAYATDRLEEIDGELTDMKSAYDDLGKAIKNTDDPIRKAELYNDRQTLAKRISEAATLAAQYEGLTSAYNDWLKAEEAGQERDMYEKLIEGFENVDDEISRGWVDDGTIEFLELLTGRTDLAGKSGKQLKEVYDGLDKTIGNSGYSIRDFFTVNEDGDSTNTGVYNFLETIESFGGKFKEAIKRNEDGNIIGFNFEVAGGDEAIADALGISEELVQIMVRAADDAGFVISMDGTYKQLADLQNEAKAAADYLRKIGKTDFQFDFNTSSVENLKTQLEEAHKILDDKKFWNKDGTFNFDADGATEAMQVVSTLQAKLDKLTEEQYGIGLTVDNEEFEEPLKNLQDYGRTVQTLNQLKLNPKVNADKIEELEGDLKEISKYFANLDDDLKVDLGLDADDNWEDVKKKIESGELKIPTVLDIQANMDKNIETLADLALLNSGLLSEDEEKVIEKKYKIEAKADDVDTSDVEEKVNNILGGGRGGRSGEPLSRKVNIKIIAETFGIKKVKDLTSNLKGLDDKTVEAVANVIGKIKVDELKQAIALLNPKQVDAIANAIGKGDVVELSDIIGQLSPKTVDAIANALGYDDVNDLRVAIENLDPKTVEAVANALGITDVEGLKAAIDNVQDKSVKVAATTSGEEKVSGLKSLINGIKDKFVTVTTFFKKIFSGGSTRNDSNGYSDVNGTANVNGTAGRAFKQGSWGTKNSGTALVGELGRETLVRDGRYYTIGDNGAEFIKYKKGDIIFNHRQTEELFANGKVTSNGGRATALVNGTAFSSGSGGIGKITSRVSAVTADGEVDTKITKKSSKKKAVVTTTIEDEDDVTGSNGEGGTSKVDGTAVGKETKEFEETFDWIATAISRIEREIDNLDNKVNNTYKSWGERNSALTDEIGKVGTEITLQSDAAAKYWNKAGEFLNHDSDYAKKIQEGTLDIDTLNQDNSNEELVEKIKEYQKWYELYLKCTDAAEKLKQTEAELYAQRFEHIQSQYDGILQGFDHTETMLNEYISQAEAKGHIVSKQYYDALIANEHARISELKGEQKALVDARDKLVEEGKIDKYSEEWYNMCAEIDGVTQAIEEGETALIGYNNALRDLDFEKFELIQERISDVTDEANFLIELMSNEKLFDDNGKLTDKGMATMGLHGQNINTYMYQADDYGAKVKEIDSKIASGEYDQYDENVIAKRREYVELQREAILNAEQEKQAIKDLVSEGIDKELEALQERIDLHNEELESMKDLYDYQKNVQKQSEEIASLEKQRAAYLNDSSSEGKAKLQEITVSLKEAREDLQETEYDRYISDQSKLLDNLYESYSEVLNTRLDNTDALIAQITDAVNIAAGAEGTIATALGAEGAIAKELVANGVTIKTTLETEAKNVGTTLSSAMRGIWNVDEGNAKSVLTTYGEGFQGKQTTTNTILGDIKTYISRMVDDVDKDAQTKVNSNKTSSSSEKDPTKDNTSSTGTKPATTTTTSNKSSGDGKPKIGDKVKFLSGKYYYDSQGVHPAGSKNQGKEVYITNVNTKSWATHPYHISTGKKLGSGDLGWLKLNQISGYATGKKNFLNNEIAWTQENGQELIVRPSDGAILTPVAKGDSVLTSAASNNIWDMANNPSEFIKDNLNLGVTNVPNNSNVNNSYSQHIDNVVFRMDNVKNYEEMLYALRDDRRFEKLVTAMTIDRIAGGSSLAKGKSIR